MKKLALLLIIVAAFAACQEGAVRYSQSSAEIDTFKAAVAAYEAGDWNEYTSKFADTAKIFYNTETNSMTAAEAAEYHAENAKGLSSYGFEDDKGDIEMVVTDDGETWVNFWGQWNATIASTGKEVNVSVHVTAQFQDGMIVKEYGYWDNVPMMNAMAEAASEDASEEGAAEQAAEEGAEESEN